MHYDRKCFYGELKNITEVNEARIRKAKIEHEEKLERGDRAQCQKFPHRISHEHLNPCYKQFTRVLADDKKEELTQRRSSMHLSSGSSMTTFFKGCSKKTRKVFW